MENTQGFYKFINETLFYAPNLVLNANYELVKENHKDYTYPIDEWYWFESEENARDFFNLPYIEVDPQ